MFTKSRYIRHNGVVAIIGTLLGAARLGEAATRDAPSLAQSASVTVDSSFSGYGTTVLTDGKWLAVGEEKSAHGLAALGNGENAWVSSEALGEHWICLEWPQPVALNEVEIWWARADWFPRAFRVELWRDGHWVPASGNQGWLVPVNRRSIVPLPETRTQRLRILQASVGARSRLLMGAQEVLVFNREGKPRSQAGVRLLATEALARLTTAVKLEPDLACLDKLDPGAAAIVAWDAKDKEKVIAVSGAKDAKPEVGLVLAPGGSLGVRWPVRHSIDRVWMDFADHPPAASGLLLQADDGKRWVPVRTGLKAQAGEGRVEWTFDPVVTRAIRVQMPKGLPKTAVGRISVFRFMPPSKDVWPDRFVQRVGIQQELLTETPEPSFEAAALKAHNMQTARAFVGLKDNPTETGVAWDGTLIGRDKIQFRFGPEQYALSEYADTVSRKLIDDWRPGVVVEGWLGDLFVRETVFALPLGAEARPAVVINLSVRNLSSQRHTNWLEVVLSDEDPDALQVNQGMLLRGGKIVLIPKSPAGVGESPGSLRVPFDLPPGKEEVIELVYPQDKDAPLALAEQYRAAPLKALEQFRRYWDGVMNSRTEVNVPEARVNNLVKAVLAQCFVCGDSNIMYYGAAPSAYEGSLFGIEESYPMVGLALFGYGKDAQRYLDGTYLTSEFLKKTDQYSLQESEFRHQQYRNGLEPHYAISVYRLTRDDDWIRPHLPLLKECADWTLSRRRRTMDLENGQKPLHWGLLPKWAYGGDIADVLCYPLFPNLCCWRGLMDTAWLLDQQGDKDAATRYRTDARDYRADIDRAIEGSYRQDQKPPFLALKLYGTQPDEQLDYYQLFAGCLLDVEAFPAHSRHARWVADYLEESNRVFCHLPRFRHIGPGALDAIYGKGYWLNLLHDDEIRDYLLAFYAFMAFNLEHETFVSRESNVLYPSDLQQRAPFPAADITDPLVCSSAVALHLVRHMLVTEERGGAGEYSGNLLLLAGTPREWLEDGKEIRVLEMPTHFGPASLEVVSHSAQGRIEARLTPPARNPCQTIKLRFRHPDGQRIRSVRVNGQAWDQFDPVNEWILLPGSRKPYRVEARY